jgi:glycosyltransferase involved in cell wall biosynthesis
MFQATELVEVPSSPPAISVVVPTHGRTDLFVATLASLEQQTLDSFEVIVTDDSSRPEERTTIQDALMAYSARSGRPASYLFSSANLGQPRNSILGLRRARGRFVRILHSDDLLAPRALEAELALLTDSRLNIEVLFHLVEAFNDCPRFDGTPVLTLLQPALFFRSVMHSGTPLPSATIFRRELLEDVGGMREDFDFLCDWDFFVRLLVTQYRRHRFLGRLTRGFVGWRVHGDNTTTRLWHRHFLEHEQYMNELRASEPLAEALIGDRGTRDGFFATAVRYRYRRLAQDLSGMRWKQFLAALPRIARCALSPDSLRERLQPAPWTAKGQRRYARLVVQGPAQASAATRRQRQPRKRRPRHVEPRAGWRFALSAHISGVLIRWGKAEAARQGVQAAAHPSGAPAIASRSGPGLLACGGRVEIHPTMAAPMPQPGVIGVMTEYNNSTNLWSLRHLIGGAQELEISQLNSNAFVEPALHQCLKHVGVDSVVTVHLIDNDHLTSFGYKALIERLFPEQFTWVEQYKDGPVHHVIRYRRSGVPHRAMTEPHSGWTFGMLTTGTRLANVERFIDSIEQHCHEPYEILIVSPVDLGAIGQRRGVRVLRFDEHDNLGWITRKKNLICAEATHSDILICHDRFSLAPDFVTDFAQWGFAYGLAAVRVRLPNGQRGLDWAVVSSQNQVWSAGGLLDYRAYSQYAYNPGGATVIRKSFWRDFPWNESLFWNEHEDVELCRRIQRAGGVIALTAATVIAEEDRWVHANPLIPYCDQNEVLYGRPVGEQRIHFIESRAA